MLNQTIRRGKGFLAVFLGALLLALSWGTAANADGGSPRALIDLGNNATAGAVVSEINTATKTNLLEYDKDGILYFDNAGYSNLSTQDKNKYMRMSLGYIRNSEMSTISKNRMYNFLADQDKATTAVLRNLQNDAQSDITVAGSWWDATLGKPVSLLLGFLTLLIFIFLTVSMTLDTSYIAIPFFRLFMSRGNEDNRPFYISQEAYQSVIEGETGAVEGNTMFIYLKKRIGFIIAVSLCLLYMITGGMYQILGFFVNFLQPIVDLFGTGY